MAKRNFYVTESEMDDYQRKVINRRSDDSLIVKGCAGSGKSVLAFWKLHEIASGKKGSVKMIVFTKALKEYFEVGLRGEGIDTQLVDYWWNWNERDSHHYDYIIVDEAQDFSRKQLESMMSHADKVLLYGDSAQQIYAFRGRDNPEDTPLTIRQIESLTGYPSESLVFNHRLPRKIARVAEYLNDENDELGERCKFDGYEKPYLIQAPTFEEQLVQISEIIRKRGFQDIGILLPQKSKLKEAAERFRSMGLGVEIQGDNLNFASSNPKLLTFHSSKGLQFEAVFIPECEDRQIKPSFEKPLYVAMTRTYQSLYLLYSNALPKKLQSAPKDLFQNNETSEEIDYL